MRVTVKSFIRYLEDFINIMHRCVVFILSIVIFVTITYTIYFASTNEFTDFHKGIHHICSKKFFRRYENFIRNFLLVFKFFFYFNVL